MITSFYIYMYTCTYTYIYMDFLEDSSVFLSWFVSILSIIQCSPAHTPLRKPFLACRMGMRHTRSSRWPLQYSIIYWVTRWLGLLGIDPIHTHSPCLIINSASSLSPKCCIRQ